MVCVIFLFDLLQSLQSFLYLSKLLSSSLNSNEIFCSMDLIMFHLQMCHGSSLLEEFFAGKAFQEVKEKAACTVAKTIEKSTEGLHQAQYSVKFKVWL